MAHTHFHGSKCGLYVSNAFISFCVDFFVLAMPAHSTATGRKKGKKTNARIKFEPVCARGKIVITRPVHTHHKHCNIKIYCVCVVFVQLLGCERLHISPFS